MTRPPVPVLAIHGGAGTLNRDRQHEAASQQQDELMPIGLCHLRRRQDARQRQQG